MEDKIKIRIALAIVPSGQWNCCGWGSPLGGGKEGPTDDDLMGFAVEGLPDGETRHWVEVEVPLPVESKIAGELSED